MRNSVILFLTIFLAGCSVIAKPAPAVSYFTLNKNSFQACENSGKKSEISVFAERTQATYATDVRDIAIIKNDGRVVIFQNAKWIALPSDMIHKSFIDAIDASCELKIGFDRRNLTLKTNLLALEANEKEVNVRIGFVIINRGEILKSAVVSSKKPLLSHNAENIVDALNLALNDIIAQILDEIKGNG